MKLIRGGGMQSGWVERERLPSFRDMAAAGLIEEGHETAVASVVGNTKMLT